jgi:phosphosulfolactate synthase (CoM biosynthesis protein A)
MPMGIWFSPVAAGRLGHGLNKDHGIWCVLSAPNPVTRAQRRFLGAGAEIIMIESEGITENVDPWRSDVAARFIDEIGMEKLMFEAADPDVFEWYIKNYGPDVNLFVDHSQIVQLECLRAGIWGTKSLWGRVVTYKGTR